MSISLTPGTPCLHTQLSKGSRLTLRPSRTPRLPELCPHPVPGCASPRSAYTQTLVTEGEQEGGRQGLYLSITSFSLMRGWSRLPPSTQEPASEEASFSGRTETFRRSPFKITRSYLLQSEHRERPGTSRNHCVGLLLRSHTLDPAPLPGNSLISFQTC